MITNVKKKLDQIFGLNRFIVAIELFPFLVKRHFSFPLKSFKVFPSLRPFHDAYLHVTDIVLYEIRRPTYTN